MSVDLSVYAQSNQPIGRNALQSRLNGLGWDIVFLKDYYSMTPASGDVIGSNELVFACPSDWVICSDLRDIIARRDRAALDKLSEQVPIACCELSVSEPEYEYDDESALAEMQADHLYAFKNAKIQYHFRTSAGRNPLSYDLQYAVWWAVGEETGGLMEDPQEGECFFSRERSADQLPSTLRYLENQPERPWWIITLYALSAVIGLVLILGSKSPFALSNWYAFLLCAQGLLAYGLYVGNRPAWMASICLNSFFVLMEAIALFHGSLSLNKVSMLIINAYIVTKLLSQKVRGFYE